MNASIWDYGNLAAAVAARTIVRTLKAQVKCLKYQSQMLTAVARFWISRVLVVRSKMS